MLDVAMIIMGVLLVVLFIHDKYIQRTHQLLINYPIIGRMRYLFEALREPMRQYFATEDFYQSRDKVNWVYKTAKNASSYVSFSPEQAFGNPKIIFKHALFSLNDDEVDHKFNLVIGKDCKKPFFVKSPIYRSAMSDGSISPEGTRAFSIGANEANFTINTGEGGFTSNFLASHSNYSKDYMTIRKGGILSRSIFHILKLFFNTSFAIKVHTSFVLKDELIDTYLFNIKNCEFYRPNWSNSIENFPKDVPEDVPDIIFQISSGLYSVRKKNGEFDFEKYEKISTFTRATEIKIAQGAKQIGGRLLGEKVTPAVAYYRGIEPYKDVESPNKFPYANTVNDLFDFIGKLKKTSNKPVGIKIVIGSNENIEPIVKEIRKKLDEKSSAYPDFINVDGGDGGSGTAPIMLMERVGLTAIDAVYLANNIMEKYKITDKVKLISAGKILTPDDAVIQICMGSSMVGVARGFMMSAGCIRARMCSGARSHKCPVGLATQDATKRASFLVRQKANHIANYHNGLIHGIHSILAVLGCKNIDELNQSKLQIIDTDGYIHGDINRILDKKLDIAS